MYRNDLVIFEFINANSEDEVLLKPSIVSDLEKFLSDCTAIWLKHEHADIKFEVLLAGVERGSVRIGFLVRAMETYNTAFDFREKIGQSIGAAGVLIGAFTPTGSASQADFAHTPAYAEACSDALERLVRVTGAAGAETVIIQLPGCGDVMISHANSREVSLIGSLGKPFNPQREGPFIGPLRKISGPFKFMDTDDTEILLYSGEVMISDERWMPVVLSWGSKRSIQSAIQEDQVDVSGSLTDLNNFFATMSNIVPNESIDPAFRKAEAYLTVSRQTVSE